MDEIDLAQQNDEFYRQQALRNHFRRAGQGRNGDTLRGNNGDTLPQSVPIKSCLDCGDEIGAARLMAVPAAVRCID